MYFFNWLFPIIGFTGILLPMGQGQFLKQLKQFTEWKELEYEFPPGEETYAKQNGQYIPGNGVPIDVDVDLIGI